MLQKYLCFHPSSRNQTLTQTQRVISSMVRFLHVQMLSVVHHCGGSSPVFFFFWTMFAYCPNLCSQLYDFLYSLYALYSHTVTCHPSAGYSPFLMTVIFTNNKKRKRLRLIKVLYDLKFLKGKKSMTSIICEQIKTCIAYAFKLDCTAVCQ